MDVYRIGVSIALANGVSPVLAIIGRDLTHLHTSIGQINNNFKGWATAIGGVSALLLGAGMLGALDKIIIKSKDMQDELIKVQRLGGDISARVVSGDISSKAFEIAQRNGMKVQDVVKIPGITNSILRGDQKEVDETWEPLAKLGRVLSFDKHFKGDMTGDLQKVIRAGELSGRVTDNGLTTDKGGQISVEKLNEWLDLVTRVTAATHGMVNADSLLNMSQQAGPALRNLTEQGMYAMAIQAQAMGGFRAGTAYMSLYQQLAGGTMLSRSAKGLESLGLLGSDEWSNDHGKVILEKSAKDRLSRYIASDPMQLAELVTKKLDEKGITDPIERNNFLMDAFGRQTTQRLMMEMVNNHAQQVAERGVLGKGYGVDDSLNLIGDKSITGNMNALSSAWNNLLVAIGGPNAENFIKVLKSITSIIDSATASAAAHPEAVKAIGLALGALGVGLAALGAVALITLGGTIGIIVGGITAIVAAIAGVAYYNWDAIKNGFLVAKAVMGAMLDMAASFSKYTGLSMLFNGLTSSVTMFFDGMIALYNRVRHIFGGAPVDAAGGEKKDNSVDELAKALRGLNDSSPSSMFNPTPPKKADSTSKSTNIYMDSHLVGQAIMNDFGSRTGFPVQAPAADGSGNAAAGDHAWSDM